jgi:hypothetical protein
LPAVIEWSPLRIMPVLCGSKGAGWVSMWAADASDRDTLLT